ncbi:MAG: peptidoglycan-binding protein, partial [Deltaproteobacteria bacterium]|nr:peptidoglycan-binding protein [Deltaproteobacteria bacterium]
YVRHRLKVAAGAEREIFDAGALEEIHRRSRGIPRLVNVLCDRSLLAGYADGVHGIGAKLVKRAAREIPDTTSRQRARSPRTASRRRAGLAAGVVAAALLAGFIVGERAGLLSEAAVWSHETVGESRFMGMLTRSGAQSDEPVDPGAPGEQQGMGGPGMGGPDVRLLEAVDAAAVHVPVSSPPPLQAALQPDSIPSVQEAVGSRGERLLNTQPGSFLGRMLDAQGVASARLHAVNAILDSYGLEGIDSAPESDEEALAIFSDRGFGLLTLTTPDLAALRALDHPALLVLRSELDDWRLVALRGLDADLGLIVGANGENELRVPVSELELQWEGEAWVVWDAVEGLPGMLTLGDEGGGVAWLQGALTELGYYPGEASGFFDGSTRAGVMALQLDRGLTPDGVVGPRTQMVIYALIDRYGVPRLTIASEDTLGTLSGAGEDTLGDIREDRPITLPAVGADLESDFEGSEAEPPLSAEDGSR